MDPVQKKPSLKTPAEEPIELTSPISPPTDLSQMPLSQPQTDEAPSVPPEPSLPDEPEKVSQPEPLNEPAIPPKKTKSKNLLAIGVIFIISISLATSLAIINRPQTTESEQVPQQPATTISPNPLQCLALGSDLIPEPGTSLTLTCSGSGIASDNPAAYRAEFKLSYSPDGTTEYSLLEDLDPPVDLGDNAQAQTSYSVPSDLENGYYYIECRICHKTEGTCTGWGQAN